MSDNGKTYNGWRNYETWVTRLWMDNDPGSQEYYQDMAERAKNSWELSQVLEADFEQGVEEQVPSTGLFADLFGKVKRAIDWREIAESYMVEE